jgi:hypothetical protein
LCPSLPTSPVDRFSRAVARPLLLNVLCAALLGFTGCGDDGRRRAVGELCDASGQCETGICGGGSCLEPEDDTDLDGLTNRVEAVLGSDPAVADTDRDGLDDFAETRGGYEVDTDGDGSFDVIESMLVDTDGDCVPNQIDPRNDLFDTDLSGLVPVVCRTVGVCAGGPMIVTCDGGKGPRCEYGAVPFWEALESSCDGRDNDCNGITDDGHPDLDRDGIADCVDDDRDGDGILNTNDSCPDASDPDQLDADADGTGDACDPPTAPTLLSVQPRPPSLDRQPRLTFMAEPLSTLRIHADLGCRNAPIGTGTAPPRNAPVPSFDIQLTVPRNAVTPLSVRATNPAGLHAPCLPLPAYEHDDLPPEPPVFIEALPASPSRMRRPTIIIGLPTTSKLASFDVHLNDSCTGAPAFTHQVLDARPFSFTVEAPANTPMPVAVIATDPAGNRSMCNIVTTWRHDSVPPCPPRLADLRRSYQTGTPDIDLVAEGLGGVTLYGDDTCTATLAVANRVGTSELAWGSCQALWRTQLRLPRDGALRVWGRAIDAAGNISACAHVGDLRLDTTAPVPPTLLHLAATGWDTGTALFRGRGLSEPVGRVEVHVGEDGPPDCAASPLVTVGTETDGTFRFSTSTPTTGVHWLRLRAIDNAGNRSECGPPEALVGPVELHVPPLAGPASLLVSDERGGIIEDIRLQQNTPSAPTEPQVLSRTIVRGASISLAHQIRGPDHASSENRILSQMDIEPFEVVAFGRGWYPRGTAGLPVSIVVQDDLGNDAWILAVRCADRRWEAVPVRSRLPASTEIPPGCLVAGAMTEAWLRPANSEGPTATITFTTPAPGPTPHQLRFGPWVDDVVHTLALTGPRTPAGGLALLLDPVGDPRDGASAEGPRAPQFWLEMSRGWNIETGGDTVSPLLPTFRLAPYTLQQHMLLLMVFDVFERIRLAMLPIPTGAPPLLDIASVLPDPIGVFAVETGGGTTIAVLSAPSEPVVTASWIEVRWNALAVEAPPLVWQVIQSSQRTTARFPDLPPPPSLLASMQPPSTSAEVRGDLDRAVHAIYRFGDERNLKAARPLLAADLFNTNLPGPPVLPRGIAHRATMSPGRFTHGN